MSIIELIRVCDQYFNDGEFQKITQLKDQLVRKMTDTIIQVSNDSQRLIKDQQADTFWKSRIADGVQPEVINKVPVK